MKEKQNELLIIELRINLKEKIMTINQISIFIENKSGTLIKVLQQLKEAKIQIVASTIADTTDYGIYRIICSEPERAVKMLREAGIQANLTEVFALRLDNKPGCAADAISRIHSAGINISYLYSFLLDGRGILIFRTNQPELTKETILLNNMDFIREEEIAKSIEK